MLEPVVAYSWKVDGFGPTGFSVPFSGGASGPDVDLVSTQTRLAPSEYHVIVTSPSEVILADGRVCSSQHPSETKPVF